MNDDTHSTYCERCSHPIGDQAFRIEVISDPPRSERIELVICSDCMGSLRQWVRKRTASRGRRRGYRARQTAYNEVLDRHERWQQRWLRWGWVVPVALFVLTGGAVAAFVSLNRFLRGRP